MSNEILDFLDFTNFTICVECIRGKQTNNKRLGFNRASEVLDLIHTFICEPFLKVSLNGR